MRYYHLPIFMSLIVDFHFIEIDLEKAYLTPRYFCYLVTLEECSSDKMQHQKVLSKCKWLQKFNFRKTKYNLKPPNDIPVIPMVSLVIQMQIKKSFLLHVCFKSCFCSICLQNSSVAKCHFRAEISCVFVH